jgi:hypothetical protein
MYLSRQLAQLHPELTMPMFSGKFTAWKLLISYFKETAKRMKQALVKDLSTLKIRLVDVLLLCL